MASVLDVTDAPGAAGGIVASGRHLGRAFYLVHGNSSGTSTLVAERDRHQPIRGLGPALMWADRRGVAAVELLADGAVAPDLARRANAVDARLEVWTIDGTQLIETAAAGPLAVPELPPAAWAFADTITAAGARPVDDHGRLVAEVAGLEVARVSELDDGSFELEVGVGQADRELQQLVHGAMERSDALVRAIGLVQEHRRPGVPLHPLNRLARERWLRSSILDQPGQLDLVEAEPLAPLRPRSTLLGTVPSAVLARTPNGRATVVVCSVGIDVDLIPEAADYRVRSAPDAELVVVLPATDVHPAIGRQLQRLDNARFATVVPPWG